MSRRLLEILAPSAGLLSFGVLFESVYAAIASGSGPDIFFEGSYTAALVAGSWRALAVALLCFGSILWSFSKWGARSGDWSRIDRVGGLRWPVLGVVATLAWNYAGHPYNYYFDQSHMWDRWLLVLLMFATLRSPLLIAVFVLHAALSKAQFAHPISAITPVGDELSVRALGIVFGAAAWNVLAEARVFRTGGGRWLSQPWPTVSTEALVFSALCLIGVNYGFAAVGKLMLGESPADWIRSSHMENLFVAAHLNGWLSQLSLAQVFEWADWIRVASVPISLATVIIELSMLFLLIHRNMTLLMLAAICAMHAGIAAMTGIIFWKWVALDAFLGCWIWVHRDAPQFQKMYAHPGPFASLIVMAVMATVANANHFAWWNTRWIKIFEVEVLAADGNEYRVDHADFAPYTLFDIYRPGSRRVQTHVYAMTQNQRLMQGLEDVDAKGLDRFFSSAPAGGDRSVQHRDCALFADFASRYFSHRNQRPGQRVFPFWLPSPALHNRHLSGAALYRDQSPVVDARLRFRELYRSDSELQVMRDEVVCRVQIPSPD